MATMASMLARIARDASAAQAAAARAARLAAASRPARSVAATRAALSAAAAASRAARSAAAARSGLCVECLPWSMDHLRSWRHHQKDSCPLPPFDPVPGLDVTDKDLESDEATWALYQHWCKHYNKERDHDEMTRRFPIFKFSAKLMHGCEHERAQLGTYADGFEKRDGMPKEVIDLWEKVYREVGVPWS